MRGVLIVGGKPPQTTPQKNRFGFFLGVEPAIQHPQN